MIWSMLKFQAETSLFHCLSQTLSFHKRKKRCFAYNFRNSLFLITMTLIWTTLYMKKGPINALWAIKIHWLTINQIDTEKKMHFTIHSFASFTRLVVNLIKMLQMPYSQAILKIVEWMIASNARHFQFYINWWSRFSRFMLTYSPTHWKPIFLVSEPIERLENLRSKQNDWENRKNHLAYH